MALFVYLSMTLAGVNPTEAQTPLFSASMTIERCQNILVFSDGTSVKVYSFICHWFIFYFFRWLSVCICICSGCCVRFIKSKMETFLISLCETIFDGPSTAKAWGTSTHSHSAYHWLWMYPRKSSNLWLDIGKLELFITTVMSSCRFLSVKNVLSGRRIRTY